MCILRYLKTFLFANIQISWNINHLKSAPLAAALPPVGRRRVWSAAAAPPPKWHRQPSQVSEKICLLLRFLECACVCLHTFGQVCCTLQAAQRKGCKRILSTMIFGQFGCGSNAFCGLVLALFSTNYTQKKKIFNGRPIAANEMTNQR